MIMQSYVPNILNPPFHLKNQSFWTDFQHKKNDYAHALSFLKLFYYEFLIGNKCSILVLLYERLLSEFKSNLKVQPAAVLTTFITIIVVIIVIFNLLHHISQTNIERLDFTANRR